MAKENWGPRGTVLRVFWEVDFAFLETKQEKHHHSSPEPSSGADFLTSWASPEKNIFTDVISQIKFFSSHYLRRFSSR